MTSGSGTLERATSSVVLGRSVMAVLAGAGVLAALLQAGCATRNVAKDRLRVVEAEAIDSRQRASTAETAAHEAQLNADSATADAQRSKTESALLRKEAEGLQADAVRGQLAQQQLEYVQRDQARRVGEVNHLRSQVSDLVSQVSDLASKPTPVVEKAPIEYRPSAAIEAFRRDLEAKLRAAGIMLPVETRSTQGGEERVAVVLRGAFPAGKASPAYDMTAVKAIVGLGELIASEYPGSHVRVEGHTDSDPIKSSPWPSNEALSLARASSVKDLLAKAGVSPALIETVGRGAAVPLETGTTKRAKETNRRVEIYILPKT